MPVGRCLWNRRVAMRDGVEIAVDVVLPPGAGPFPTVVTRTPYMRVHLLGPHGWAHLVEDGYAYVAVDVRGRGDSDGSFMPFQHDAEDAYDTIEWIADQPWCSGRIGMVGSSYEALTQWWTAKARPPHLSCIAPMAVGVASLGPRPRAGTGVPQTYFLMLLHRLSGRTLQYIYSPNWSEAMGTLPMRDLAAKLGVDETLWNAYLDGDIDYLSDDFALTDSDWAQLTIPVLVTVGWWDDQSTMATWARVARSPGGPQSQLLIGPWDHVGNTQPRPFVGGVDVSEHIIDPLQPLRVFLARHLKGDDGGTDPPRCRVFRTGSMRWEDHDAWPAPGATGTAWHLDAGEPDGSGTGRLDTAGPREECSASTYRYDPHRASGDLAAMDPWGDPPLDRRFLYRRPDHLVFDTEPLAADLSVSGRADLDLAFSSDRPDTDVFAELADVAPDGRSVALKGASIGSLRLSLRNGPDPNFLEPGAVVRARLPVTWLHHTFPAGHRIRLVISSSDHPASARNLNTTAQWSTETVPVIASNTVHHSALHDSVLLLPVEKSASR